MPLMFLCTVAAAMAVLVIGASLGRLRKRRNPFAVDIGDYICKLRNDALPECSERFEDLLTKYLSQRIPESEEDLARQLNALSYMRVGKLFVELMQLDYVN